MQFISSNFSLSTWSSERGVDSFVAYMQLFCPCKNPQSAVDPSLDVSDFGAFLLVASQLFGG